MNVGILYHSRGKWRERLQTLQHFSAIWRSKRTKRVICLTTFVHQARHWMRWQWQIPSLTSFSSSATILCARYQVLPVGCCHRTRRATAPNRRRRSTSTEVKKPSYSLTKPQLFFLFIFLSFGPSLKAATSVRPSELDTCIHKIPI